MDTLTLILILTPLSLINIIILIIILRKSANNSSATKLNSIDTNLDKINLNIKSEISQNREEGSKQAREDRKELNTSLNEISNSLLTQLNTFSKQQKDDITTLSNKNENGLEKMRSTLEERLKSIQEDNSAKLEKMRETVDEKLHKTLEKRLGESFQLVSTRLEQVYKGLGEMQSLASGVGDLKKVLTNVKTRGVWGEVQLGFLLEEFLVPEQYAKNVRTKKRSQESVEFAVKLPGRSDKMDEPVWLPIDSKFPQEDYDRLVDAQESADPELCKKIQKQLEMRIKSEARTIRDKYINPPTTTDFGIMFLPIESLYAEVLRIPGLLETLRTEHKIIITGPTTFTALLSSLQIGFRTVAIEQRTSEVWKLLGAIKTQFRQFGEILDKTQKKLQEAGNTITQASDRSRQIEKKLKKVEELPQSEALELMED